MSDYQICAGCDIDMDNDKAIELETITPNKRILNVLVCWNCYKLYTDKKEGKQ